MRQIKPEQCTVGPLLDALREAGATVQRAGSIKCPFHDDKSPSMGTFQGDDGVWRAKCHTPACGFHGDVFDVQAKRQGVPVATVLRDTNAPPVVATPKAKPRVYSTLAELHASIGSHNTRYDYLHAETDEVVMAVFRIGAKPNKRFVQASVAGGGWVMKAPPKPWPIYNQPAVLTAETVVVVEGEKCVHALAAIGIVATTSPGGAVNAKNADWSMLGGKRLVLWPDNDDAGAAYMADVIDELSRVDVAPLEVSMVNVGSTGVGVGGDVADFLEVPERGRGDVDQLLDEAEPVILSPKAGESPVGEPVKERGLVVVRLSTVKPEQLEWLWRGRFPLGKLSLIAGNPGLGKSWVSLDVAARVTRGDAWPDGSPNTAGRVLLISCEDGLSDTIVPRLMAADADLDRIDAIKGVRRAGSRGEFLFSIEDDLPELEALIVSNPELRLVCIDPIGAFLGSGDSHKDTEVRAMMAPLVMLAEKYGVAIIGVMHLNKGAGNGGAMYRLSGSLAFPAVARAAWLVTEHPDDKDRRLMSPIKANLSERPEAVAFEIGGDPAAIKWGETVEMTADDVMARMAEANAADASINPTEWLKALLARGPVACDTVQAEARQLGIGESRFKAARKALRVEARRKGGLGADGKWFYELPPGTEPVEFPDSR